nr:immunoglobulin heavy chain junction region [Mus musculus]MBK4184049.1 immunoglobulin heavy chain junction region [Mus musculus]
CARSVRWLLQAWFAYW